LPHRLKTNLTSEHLNNQSQYSMYSGVCSYLQSYGRLVSYIFTFFISLSLSLYLVFFLFRSFSLSLSLSFSLSLSLSLSLFCLYLCFSFSCFLVLIFFEFLRWIRFHGLICWRSEGWAKNLLDGHIHRCPSSRNVSLLLNPPNIIINI